MKHSDFTIGEHFFTGSGEWLCTDKGTRVIIAIHMEDGSDPSWLNGPPYSIDEAVFDEYGMDDCYKHPMVEE